MSVFIVAEAGVNHLGDRAKMLALCDAAKAAGADAVKFQAYDTERLCTRRWTDIRNVPLDTINLLRDSELSDADLDAIAAHCKAIGIKWFASVFDPSQIERVLSRGACALKIGHAERNYGELVSAARRSGKRFWISVVPGDHPGRGGMWRNTVLCTPEYPATSPPRLQTVGDAHPIDEWEEMDPGYKGFSSHYTDYRIPAAAALRGAEYIEAHLKLSDDDPEAAWSLSPDDFAAMVKLIREYSSWL